MAAGSNPAFPLFSSFSQNHFNLNWCYDFIYVALNQVAGAINIFDPNRWREFYFPYNNTPHQKESLPALPDAGTFTGKQFNLSNEAQSYLEKFIEDNPDIKFEGIKAFPEARKDQVLGQFTPDDPTRIHLYKDPSGKGPSMLTLVHELEHLKKAQEKDPSMDSHRRAIANHPSVLQSFFTAHTNDVNLGKAYTQAITEGIFTPEGPKENQSFESNGLPRLEAELDARKAEREYLGNPNFAQHLEAWRMDPWTVDYPLTSVFKATQEFSNNVIRPFPVRSDDEIVPVQPAERPSNMPLKYALELEPRIRETYTDLYNKVGAELGIPSNLTRVNPNAYPTFIPISQ